MAKKKDEQQAKIVDIEDISIESLLCRDLRHPFIWKHDYEVARVDGQPVIITRYLICPQCGSEAWDDLAVPSFERIRARRIKYSEGYLRKNVEGRVSAAEVRREYYKRAIGDPEKIITGRRKRVEAK